ncbi:MAG: type I-E CRISPR-associated protein Cse2/CasB [Bacteroidia bacterium]|nr:type I-E CRISPR-associated protein Cse2/CasB [Bacteroidia bacterium]
MTNDKKPEKDFIERIEKLGSGELARLRRGCGERDPVEGRCPWLIAFIHGVASQPAAFLVASLLAQYSTVNIHAGRHRMEGDFGLTWKRAIAGNGSDSIKRRFHILLDAEYEPRSGDGDMPYRLRQMVRYAAGKGIGVDWPLLLEHVRNWNAQSKWVQKKWASTFFSIDSVENHIQNPEEKE